MVQPRDGSKNYFGFVQFKYPDSAKQAVKLDGQYVNGTKIAVDMAKQNVANRRQDIQKKREPGSYDAYSSRGRGGGRARGSDRGTRYDRYRSRSRSRSPRRSHRSRSPPSRYDTGYRSSSGTGALLPSPSDYYGRAAPRDPRDRYGYDREYSGREQSRTSYPSTAVAPAPVPAPAQYAQYYAQAYDNRQQQQAPQYQYPAGYPAPVAYAPVAAPGTQYAYAAPLLPTSVYQGPVQQLQPQQQMAQQTMMSHVQQQAMNQQQVGPMPPPQLPQMPQQQQQGQQQQQQYAVPPSVSVERLLTSIQSVAPMISQSRSQSDAKSAPLGSSSSSSAPYAPVYRGQRYQ